MRFNRARKSREQADERESSPRTDIAPFSSGTTRQSELSVVSLMARICYPCCSSGRSVVVPRLVLRLGPIERAYSRGDAPEVLPLESRTLVGIGRLDAALRVRGNSLHAPRQLEREQGAAHQQKGPLCWIRFLAWCQSFWLSGPRFRPSCECAMKFCVNRSHHSQISSSPPSGE